MNVILPIAIYVALALAGLGILGMGISGLRSLLYGKVEVLSIAIIAIPGVLVLVFRATAETWVQAGIYTLTAMFALALIGMLVTAVRSLFV